MPNEMTRPVDLTDCAREPIHVPGFIQQFGVLLAMPTGSERISQISANTDLIFGVEPLELIGQKLSRVLGEESAAEIAQVLQAGNRKEINPLKLSIVRGDVPLAVNAIVHRYDGLDFVELEPISDEHAEAAKRSYQLVQTALTRLQRSLSSPDLWETVVSEVQRVTGYDRVMLYKFDRDEHGHVIAERRREHQQPFFGLHYPASDIPEQARRLYRENWIRYIPDVHYKPVPLIPVVDEDHKRLTDLTHSVLRSVSPIHCEYLHNMGVAASMSVSVLRDGRLWGLIACHNDTPRYLPFELRAACELLGQVLSIRIAALEDTEDSTYKSKTNALQARFLADLPQHPNLATALVSQTPNLLSFIPATGAAVCFGDTISPVGRVPTDEQIRLILRSTLNRVTAPIFVTDRLQDRVMEATGLTDTASGVLCFTVSRPQKFHVLWFRTEQVQVMKWGGEPTKPIEFDEAAQRLSPRKSFEIWKQKVRGKSQAWLQPEIEAAAELRATLMSLLLIGQK
jgi:light-regulated signal transduction histidine kinase (bacteriophytochrome)